MTASLTPPPLARAAVHRGTPDSALGLAERRRDARRLAEFWQLAGLPHVRDRMSPSRGTSLLISSHQPSTEVVTGNEFLRLKGRYVYICCTIYVFHLKC